MESPIPKTDIRRSLRGLAAAAASDSAYPRLIEEPIEFGWVAYSEDENGDLTDGVYADLWPIETSPGSIAWAYCLDRDKTAIPGPMHEGDFAKMNPRIEWILNHSYPTLTLAELEASSGVTGLDEAAAITATQMAIWNLGGSERTPGNSWDTWDYWLGIVWEDPTNPLGAETVPLDDAEIARGKALYESCSPVPWGRSPRPTRGSRSRGPARARRAGVSAR